MRLILVLVAISVAVMAGTTLCAVSSPDGPFAERTASYLPLPDVWRARAAAEPDPGKARRLILREIGASPARADGWLRLAYIDTCLHNGLPEEEALNALSRSYRLSPYDLDLGVWRLAFVFGHWQSAGPDLRNAAIRELTGLWRVGRLRADLRNLPASVADPAGRLAAAMTIDRLNSAQVHE